MIRSGPCRNVKPFPWRSVTMCCAGVLLSFPLMKCPEGASPFSGHCSLFPSPLYRGSSGPAYWHFSFPSRKRPEIRLCVIGKLNCLSLLFVINSIQTHDSRWWVLTLYYCSPTFLELAQDKCLRVISYIPLQFSAHLPPHQLFFCSLIILLRAFGIWSKRNLSLEYVSHITYYKSCQFITLPTRFCDEPERTHRAENRTWTLITLNFSFILEIFFCWIKCEWAVCF